MKYTNLKNDIVNILHSEDYELYLKFYDENGNTTLNIDESIWCYIHNYNIMIKFMDENNKTLLILKDNKSLNNNFKEIIQRLREICILNGISVQIKTYDNLNQRKLYNFIKNDILQKKQDKKMNESYNKNKLIESFYNMINVAKNTKKNSDFYLCEEIKNNNSQMILKEMIEEINSYYNFKDLDLKNNLKQLLTCQSLDEIKSFTESLDNKICDVLYENIETINNSISFVKNEYINNIDLNNTSKNKTLLILENVKVYPLQETTNKDNLIKAYNELIKESHNIKSDTDIIRVIRNKKICESYNVSRNELIDMWLSHDCKQIEPKRVFVFETSTGEKIIFNSSIKCGLKILAEHINNGGTKDDTLCNDIINETIKYNSILSFLNEYKDSFKLKDYNLKFRKMLKDSYNKLQSNNLNCFYSENINYDNELSIILETLGINHMALKYIAIEEAKQNMLYSKILIENNINDMNILTKELKLYTKSLSELQNLVENIMKHNIKLTEQLNETFNKKDFSNILNNIYNQFCFENDNQKLIIASSLFNIIHSKTRLNENKLKYVETLIKYIQ